MFQNIVSSRKSFEFDFDIDYSGNPDDSNKNIRDFVKNFGFTKEEYKNKKFICLIYLDFIRQLLYLI
jgi:hypothetical protein